jgi:hypothetical protein
MTSYSESPEIISPSDEAEADRIAQRDGYVIEGGLDEFDATYLGSAGNSVGGFVSP